MTDGKVVRRTDIQVDKRTGGQVDRCLCDFWSNSLEVRPRQERVVASSLKIGFSNNLCQSRFQSLGAK